MEDLIAALQIFAKYTKARSPTSCEHDVLYVQVDPEKVSIEDRVALEKLSFQPDEELEGVFYSYRFGSC